MPTGSLRNNKITHLSSPFLCATFACFILHHQSHTPCLHSTMITSPDFDCNLGIPALLTNCTISVKKTKHTYIHFYLQVSFCQIISSTDMVQWAFQPVCCFVQNLAANPCQQRNFYLSKFHLPLRLPQPRRKLLINTPTLNVFSFPCRAQQDKSQPSVIVSTLFCINILPKVLHCLGLGALLIKNGSYTVSKGKKVCSFFLDCHNNGLWGELDGQRERYWGEGSMTIHLNKGITVPGNWGTQKMKFKSKKTPTEIIC